MYKPEFNTKILSYGSTDLLSVSIYLEIGSGHILSVDYQIFYKITRNSLICVQGYILPCRHTLYWGGCGSVLTQQELWEAACLHSSPACWGRGTTVLFLKGSRAAPFCSWASPLFSVEGDGTIAPPPPFCSVSLVYSSYSGMCNNCDFTVPLYAQEQESVHSLVYIFSVWSSIRISNCLFSFHLLIFVDIWLQVLSH